MTKIVIHMLRCGLHFPIELLYVHQKVSRDVLCRYRLEGMPTDI